MIKLIKNENFSNTCSSLTGFDNTRYITAYSKFINFLYTNWHSKIFPFEAIRMF